MSPSTEPAAPAPGSVDDLAARIRHHRAAYYAGAPEISDAEYDWLEDELRRIAPDHPELARVGAPPPDAAFEEAAAEAAARLGAAEDVAALAADLLDASDAAYEGRLADDRATRARYKGLWLALGRRAPDHPALADAVPPEGVEWARARHELPMGSLNKVNTPQELAEWAARCDELAIAAGLPPISSRLAVTEKLDGLSLEVVYDGGALVLAITRGDGELGERITPNVRRMRGVPSRIALGGRVSVRGEIILEREAAPALDALRAEVSAKATPASSLRNSAAGAARGKRFALLPACRLVRVLFYDVEGVEGLSTEAEKLALLEAQGFGVPAHEVGDVAAVVARYQRYAGELRSKLPHDIDGLVVRADDLRTQALLGELDRRPRAAVAFKFPHEEKVTLLHSVLWSTGDTGRITPIAQVEGVELAGANVTQASLHNLARVRLLGVGPGAHVLVSRRGDVIPYVERVVLPGPAVEPAPTRCMDCEGPVSVEGEYLVCRNERCPARLQGRMSVWLNQLGLLGWGEGRIEAIFDEGLARSVPDLYRFDVERLAEVRGGPKRDKRLGLLNARKILEPLLARREIPLPTFVAALGIEQVSKETAKLLVDAGLDTFEKMLAATPEALAAIPGLGEIKAEKIATGLAARREEVEELATLGVRPVRPSEGGPLAGLSFCFSGASNRPRKALEGAVERLGGRVASSVVKGLSYLVLADPASTSSKAEKARKLGTAIIDEGGFEALVVERGGRLDG